MKACQVVPDIPSFAVDDGFTYLIPEGLDVSIGSRVRVRVSGRRLKGFVTALFDAEPGRKLLEIDGLSGTVPGFDAAKLDTLRWAASHYVCPLSVILKRTMPPNVPKGEQQAYNVTPPEIPSIQVVVSGAHEHLSHLLSIVADTVSHGRGAVIIAPTIVEVDDLVGALREQHGDIVVAASSATPAKDSTHAWVRAATTSPVVLVGTREIMFWPVLGLRTAIVVEDARRVMKSPATPTLGVREVIIRRARSERFDVTFLSPVPSLESVTVATAIDTPPGRHWPLVEIADRGEEPPSRSLLLDRTRNAITSNLKRGAKAFVLVPARGYAPAFRCIRCGELRRCAACGTAAMKTGDCRRCGTPLTDCRQCGGQRFEPLGAGIGSVRDAIARSVGDAVGLREEAKPITVGSERDIIDHPPVELAVSIDIDGLAHAPTYRAAEDALRLHARVAHLVRRGSGNRLLVQTALPNQPVIEALRSGRSDSFLADLMVQRRRAGFPPFGELIALEIDRKVDARDQIRDELAPVATVLGPAALEDRDRWLIQGRDLTEARIRLRRIVGGLRDRGARVRVDADPLNL